jgi:hypothetical protein
MEQKMYLGPYLSVVTRISADGDRNAELPNAK